MERDASSFVLSQVSFDNLSLCGFLQILELFLKVFQLLTISSYGKEKNVPVFNSNDIQKKAVSYSFEFYLK